MSAAYPNQTDAEKAILSAMEFTSTYSSDDIKGALLPHFTEFLEGSLESLVTKGLLKQDGIAYFMTWKGQVEKIRYQQAQKELNRNI